MNYELLLAFMRCVGAKKRSARYHQWMNQLDELLFLYNFAWVEIGEARKLIPRNARCKYEKPLSAAQNGEISRYAA
jgi:hypothetical protein